jgi:putative DNA primase/helicase
MDVIEKWVWFYHNNGYSIIPLGRNKGYWNNKEDELKKPSLRSWDKYKTERATKEEITRWLKEGLFVNIGFICGNISNDVVVIDIDDETIPNDIGLNLQKITETGAWVVETGKGYHIYAKHHGNPGGIKRLLKHKIEYRSNNGYVVAPPSIHPSGKKYKFIGIDQPEDLPELEKKDVKLIFEDLKKRIGEKRNIEEKIHSYKGKFSQAKETNDPPECVKIALRSKTIHPMRYYIKYGIASSYVMRGIKKEETMKILKDFNKNMCEPPEDDSIVEQAVNGAYQEDAHLYGCEFWMDDADVCPFENIMECPYGKKKAKRDLLREYRVFDWEEKTNKETGKKYIKITGVKPTKLARLLINEFDLHFITIRDTKEIYYFNDGMYHPGGETKISELAEFFLEDQTTTHHINEVLTYITHNNYVDRGVFDSPIHLINLENGVYNIQTKTLESHNSDHFFINKIHIVFNPDAKCEKIIKFVSEVLYAEDIPVLQEFAGYCLYRRYHIHKSCMLLGGGKNGKSSFIRLMVKFLGKENVSNKELKQITEDRFSLSALYGKLLNSASDISNEALQQTGKFKELTGEDPVDAEVKFKDSFSFVNYAKFLFSANKLPKTTDESYAFFRRWILLSFPNTFEGDLCNSNIIEDITTPEELSGFFNWAMEGLQRLLTNGDFSYGKTVEDVAEQYKTLSDPIYAYVHEFLICKAGEYIFKDDLYQSYIEWAKKQQLPITPKNTFTSEISKHLYGMRAGKRGAKGLQKPTYENIIWKSLVLEQEKETVNGQSSIRVDYDDPDTYLTGEDE